MSNPSINLNKAVATPGLPDLLASHKKDIMLNFNCHAIAKIQSFDPDTQTATATINYKKTFFVLDSTGQYVPNQVDYPVLIDCPVVILSGGTAHLTFPISKGDDCLVLFNDRDIDNWFQSGQVGPVATSRLHSFADGVLLVGLRSSQDALSDYDPARAVLRNDTTGVGVSPTHVKVYNATTTLNTVMQNILTQLENLAQGITLLTVTCASPGSPSSVPINAATFATIQSQLTTLATQLGSLIE